MENEALHNQWQYPMQQAPKPTPLSPEEVLQLGMQPVSNAITTYAQQRFAERIQQQRLEAAAKNVAARDAMWIERAKEQDQSRERAAAISEKARADATEAQGVNDRAKQAILTAKKYGTQLPPIPQDTSPKSLSDWTTLANAANDKRLHDPDTGLVSTMAKNYVSGLNEQDKIRQDTTAYIQKNSQQALSYAAAENPPEKFIDRYAGNPKIVDAFNSAGGGTAGLRAAGIGTQYVQYLSGLAGRYAQRMIDDNAGKDPEALALKQRAMANQIQLDTMMKDKSGVPLDYAPEVQQSALQLYAQQQAAAAKTAATTTNGAVDPNHPAVGAAHRNILDKQAVIQQQQQRLGLPTFGTTSGGADIDTTKTVTSPSINPLAALKSSAGLPTPSGRGALFLDANNQIQYAPSSSGQQLQPSPVGPVAAPAPISPEDVLWAKRIAGSNLFKSLVSPPAAAPAQTSVAANNLVLPPISATPTPVAAPAPVTATTGTGTVYDRMLNLLPPVPAAQIPSGGGGSAMDNLVREQQSPYMANMAASQLGLGY